MTSDRCYMQLLAETDFPEVLQMFSEPEVWTFIQPWKGKTREEYTDFLKLKLREIRSALGYYWLIRENESNELIGAINVTPIPRTDHIQIGWMVREKFQKQGFAFEGAQMAMQFVLNQTDIDPVYAVYDRENIASEKIIQKLGFHRFETFSEGDRTLHKYVFKRPNA